MRLKYICMFRRMNELQTSKSKSNAGLLDVCSYTVLILNVPAVCVERVSFSLSDYQFSLLITHCYFYIPAARALFNLL